VVVNKKSSLQRTKGKQTAADTRTTSKPHANTQASSIATIDRRDEGDRRSSSDRRKLSLPVAVEHRATERRVKVTRRRQIDPTTCERDHTSDEIEFMGAMDEYKRRNGRMFPTCSEVLEVIKSLGYQKCPTVDPLAPMPIDLPVSATDNLISVG
jgi:hypothetical protein